MRIKGGLHAVSSLVFSVQPPSSLNNYQPVALGKRCAFSIRKIPRSLCSHLCSWELYSGRFLWFRFGCSVCNLKWQTYEMSDLFLCSLVIMTLFICTAFISIFLILFSRPPAILPAVYSSTVWNYLQYVHCANVLAQHINFTHRLIHGTHVQVCIVNCCAARLPLVAHLPSDINLSFEITQSI